MYNKIPFNRIGECKSFFEDGKMESICMEILRFSGMKEEIVQAAIYGITPTKCDTEFGENSNWCNQYDLRMLSTVIEFANKFMSGIQLCEVGMKYPNFTPSMLIKKYRLTLNGLYEPKFSREYTKQERKTFYEVWQNEDRSISFSFEKDRMGKGGYAGAIFQTHEDAIKFTKWFFNHKKWYVKDWDLFDNGLGGLGINEIIEFNEPFLIEKKLYENVVVSYVEVLKK